jgi:hypothetical protein
MHALVSQMYFSFVDLCVRVIYTQVPQGSHALDRPSRTILELFQT